MTLLAQYIDGASHGLLDIFKEEKESCLLGAESFWQGVDVPGSALELVIITRLPFSVPTEPMAQAQMELAKSRGLNPFKDYSMPEAVLRFRQGIGRLIRSPQDKGAIVVLDSRINKFYGKYFMESLHVKKNNYGSVEGLQKDVANWLKPQ